MGGLQLRVLHPSNEPHLCVCVCVCVCARARETNCDHFVVQKYTCC